MGLPSNAERIDPSPYAPLSARSPESPASSAACRLRTGQIDTVPLAFGHLEADAPLAVDGVSFDHAGNNAYYSHVEWSSENRMAPAAAAGRF